MYRFKNSNGCITYQKGICGEDGTLMFIIETPGSFSKAIEHDIIQFGNLRINMKYIDKQFVISCNSGISTTLESFKSYLCIIRWNRSNYTISLDVYNYKHRDNVPVYMLRPEMYWFDFENPVCSIISDYDNCLCMPEELPCQVHAYPLQLTNIKYYNTQLSDEEILTESIRYTTNHKNCVINDLARHITTGVGFAVK
jgi:hypothetical protein